MNSETTIILAIAVIVLTALTMPEIIKPTGMFLSNKILRR